MKVPRVGDGESMELKMTPMIDVVFLLLVFFVWTSSFELPEFDLPGAIAQPPTGGRDVDADAAPSEAFDEIVIRLRMQQATLIIEFNGQPVDNPQALRSRLAEIVSLGVQPPVIVDPADDITMKVAVEIYDTARAAGVDRVLFAAEP